MSTNSEVTLMKRAALQAVVRHAIKTGSIKLTKTATERHQRMVTFLKQGGVTGREVRAFCQGIQKQASTRMPSEQAFERVARAAHMDVRTVKLAYLGKKALLSELAGGGLGAMAGKALGGGNPLAMLAGGAVGALAGGGAAQIPQAISHQMNPYQMTPERRALYARIQNESIGNQRLSQDLQAMSGAFRPAANPWGATQGR